MKNKACSLLKEISQNLRFLWIDNDTYFIFLQFVYLPHWCVVITNYIFVHIFEVYGVIVLGAETDQRLIVYDVDSQGFNRGHHDIHADVKLAAVNQEGLVNELLDEAVGRTEVQL